MGVTEDVLRHLIAGSDAFAIMDTLKLAPSKLDRVLESPTMRRYLRMQGLVAASQMRIRLSGHALDVPSKLEEISQCGNPEIARRACVNLMQQLACLDKTFSPPPQLTGTGRQAKG